MHTILTFMGNELTDHHYTQLSESSQREFHVRLPTKPELSDRLYFLLGETEIEKILASGYLKSIHPVIFNHETFSFLILRFGKEVVLFSSLCLFAYQTTKSANSPDRCC